MSEVTLSRSWIVSEPTDDLEAVLADTFGRHGMEASVGDHAEIDLEGGSALQSRLLGGWLCRDKALPRYGQILRSTEAGGERITLHLREEFGPGIMDPRLEQKYERVFAEIASSTESALRAHAAAVQPAG